MATTITAAFDGSALARSAVRWALGEAAAHGVDLRVVTAVQGTPPASLWGVPAPPRVTEEELQAARTGVDDALRDVFQEHADVPVDVVVRAGHPSAVLIQESRDSALIVVGSTGIDGFVRSLLGSVTTAVIAHAHCPVTIVR